MNAPLPDWRSDWLYALILREAEAHWRQCTRRPHLDVWQYVLIQEFPPVIDDDMSRVGIMRAWIRNAEGLREISVEEGAEHQHQLRKSRSPFYPFILMHFTIESNRERVALGRRMATKSGMGGRYLVQGQGSEAKLVLDPTGRMWVS